MPLTACGDGYWTGLVEAAAGTRYAYSLDGGPPRPDPASRLQPDGVNQPSAVVDPAFEWHDAAWRGMSLAGAVVYELHVGTFTPAGTFDAAVAELDALIDLGVTAIELMPVAQFPGERNWGYDGVHPFAVQNSYGGPAGLKRLVDACHGRGLGVALDVVYNHFGPEGNYLAEFGPYFTPRHQTPWGPAVNFEGPESDPVRRFFIDNALMWIGEFHVDALRLDAIHAIVDQSANPFLAELAAAVHSCAAQLGRPAWLIAENNRNDPRIFAPAQAGGYALDAQWLDDFGRALQALLTGDRAGFYADFGRAADLAKAWRHGYVLSGQTSRYRGRRHGADSSAVPCERLLAYAQCHDQVGNRPRSDRLSTQVDFDALRLAAAALLLSPYPALLFMGEEYGEPAPFHYFVSHLDPDLVERVRAGRRCEFAAFRWPTEPADPQAESTFAASKLDLSLRHDPRHRPLWDCYRELIRLRRELLTHTEPRAAAGSNRRSSPVCWFRPAGGQALKSPSCCTLPPPAIRWLHWNSWLAGCGRNNSIVAIPAGAHPEARRPTFGILRALCRWGLGPQWSTSASGERWRREREEPRRARGRPGSAPNLPKHFEQIKFDSPAPGRYDQELSQI